MTVYNITAWNHYNILTIFTTSDERGDCMISEFLFSSFIETYRYILFTLCCGVGYVIHHGTHKIVCLCNDTYAMPSQFFIRIVAHLLILPKKLKNFITVYSSLCDARLESKVCGTLHLSWLCQDLKPLNHISLGPMSILKFL